MLHHVCDMVCEENKCGPIRTCKCRDTNWLNYMFSINYVKVSLISLRNCCVTGKQWVIYCEIRVDNAAVWLQWDSNPQPISLKMKTGQFG